MYIYSIFQLSQIKHAQYEANMFDEESRWALPLPCMLSNVANKSWHTLKKARAAFFAASGVQNDAF